jgi:hypothetical protein
MTIQNEYTVVVEFTDGTAVTEVVRAANRYNAMSMVMLRARMKQRSTDLESVAVVMALSPAQAQAEETSMFSSAELSGSR